jgi:5-methylcytosine-specific restriction endonuclease McrA
LWDRNRKFHPIISSARTVWLDQYHKNNRDIEFEPFYNMSQQSCYYCGKLPSNKLNTIATTKSEFQKNNGTFVYNGLDRVDNNLPHIAENLVTCCKQCNNSKTNHTKEEFFEMVKNIYEKHLSKDTIYQHNFDNILEHRITQ